MQDFAVILKPLINVEYYLENTYICGMIGKHISQSEPRNISQVLFPPQAELLASDYLRSRENWVICAPTGAGKTLMGEWALKKAIESGYKAAYIAPLKAIVQEKLVTWTEKYPNYTIELFTGDTTRAKGSCDPNKTQLLLLTPEKLSSYVYAWKRHLRWLANIDTLVLDEFHLLGDASRGAGIESLITRVQRINPFVRIVALSATLGNASCLADWLRAQLFTTHWRPVPIERRVIRFKKANEKIEILHTEVRNTVHESGKVLVFVNSRRRTEEIAAKLREFGFSAEYHHAGLNHEQRVKAQHAFRTGQFDAIVTTSALEMGVNFPARKVVIYDSYGFDGETFSPMTVRSYLQCSGRAGRPGFDDRGESVLLLPAWGPSEKPYITAEPEPVNSALFSSGNLIREVLYDAASRLSITREHLAQNFVSRTLWRKQGGKKDVDNEVNFLINSKLLKTTQEESFYLSATALGRAATQMGICPQTIMLLVRFYQLYPTVVDLDLLLVACLAREASPKLGFNFEEIDNMASTILSIPSHMLDQTFTQVRELENNIAEKRILSAVKCATILYQHTQGEELDVLAEGYDCYPFDLRMLKDNVGWVLETAQRVFSILWQEQQSSENPEEEKGTKIPCIHETMCRTMRAMLEYGVPKDCIGLVSIRGIGHSRAKALISEGIHTPSDLIKLNASKIGKILKLGITTATNILDAAHKAIALQDDPFSANNMQSAVEITPIAQNFRSAWKGCVDPYRLRRALELRVDHVSGECVRISGGAEPHTVKILAVRNGCKEYECDCQDFIKGHPLCKHVIRARLELHDDYEILDALRMLQNIDELPLRFALGNLWVRNCGLFDSYNGRTIDYAGKEFLERAQARKR